QSYLGIIVHFLSIDFEAHSFLLTTTPANHHDAENIASEILEVLKVWELGGKSVGMVGDNTKVVPKTATVVAEDPDFEEFEFWGCFAHLVNLVVKHGLELVRTSSLCLVLTNYRIK